MINEIDQHLENFAPIEKSEGMSANALHLLSICNAWQKVKPIVNFVKPMLFFKPKWQKAIEEFVAIADGICPAN